MRTTLRIAAALLITAALLLGTTWAQDEMRVVDNGVFDRPQRTPAVFAHDEHNETAGIDDCATCHHVWQEGQRVEGESSEDQRCSDCHSLTGGDGAPKLIKAFHQGCKGCHEKENKGPILCGECHVK